MAHKQCDTVVGKRVVTDQQNEFGEMRNEAIGSSSNKHFSGWDFEHFCHF